MIRIISYLLISLCLISCIKERKTGGDLVVGDSIPDFTVTMNDGMTLSGTQLSEGVACIVFFTTLCPDCRQTLPHIQSVYDEYAGKGVRFALISREEGQESISAYWPEHGFSMPYSAQTDRHIYELFARTRVPRVYICRGGVIRSVFTDSPVPTYEDLKAALDGALNEY